MTLGDMTTQAAQVAEQRVNNEPKLSQHYDDIFYGWTNWDEHLEWITTAPIEEIVDWAEMIE